MPLRAPHTLSPGSCVALFRVNGVERRFPGQAARAPGCLAAHRGPRPWMLPANSCYPRPLRAPASRRFPCSVREWLAPLSPCRESPVFHDTLLAGVSPFAFEGGISSSVLERTNRPPGAPVAPSTRLPTLARRAELPVRVDGRHPWREPRSLPPPIREDRAAFPIRDAFCRGGPFAGLLPGE
jgi:hypothetical protein